MSGQRAGIGYRRYTLGARLHALTARVHRGLAGVLCPVFGHRRASGYYCRRCAGWHFTCAYCLQTEAHRPDADAGRPS